MDILSVTASNVEDRILVISLSELLIYVERLFSVQGKSYM